MASKYPFAALVTDCFDAANGLMNMRESLASI
ncbi:hypothetical protein [Paenibacillus cookii]